MCGRYTVYTESEIIEMKSVIAELDRKFGMQPPPGEVRPTNIVPVIDRYQQVQAAKWGFPKWNNKGVIINARSETALDKTTFKNAVLNSRCVVPSTGFFEWQHDGNGKSTKQKFLCKNKDSDMLYMAGASKEVKDSEGNITVVFVILTTEAVDPIRAIHDRMPVILRKDEIARWLNDCEFIGELFDRQWINLELVRTE